MLVFAFALHVSTLSVIAFVEPSQLPLIMRDRLSCMILFGLASMMAGTYKSFRLTDRFDAVYFTLLALAVALVAKLALTKLVAHEAWVLSRRELVLGAAVAAPLLAIWRFWAAGFLATHFKSLHRYYFVIGDENEAKRIVKVINEDSAVRAKACHMSLDSLKKRHAIHEGRQGNPEPTSHEAIIAHTGVNRDELCNIITMCDHYFSRTFLYPSQHDAVVFQHHNLQPVAGIPLIQVAGQQRTASYPYLKRLMDIVCAAIGLILSSPLLIVTAIAVKLSSPGPVFFIQERLGKDGRPFRMYKFRSMYHQVDEEAAPVRAEREDPRVTAVGRIIRKYKIDEFPQMLNVLRGDMSLVGPRPLWESFFDGDPNASSWRNRLTVRPGLSGLSHVLSSSHFTPADLLRYDLMYIKNRSFLADLRILFATVRVVLSGKGGQ
ncbi:MAG TPA: exopolysaccharide biosynthesis polyprenyl glycosylphosphotransferase [Candidatus Hydrogenedentes bacterium]|nr:exopolysaccharide biosynthesis polyprenyl glycosylphosphotransferase [Candidatus Hydrogenedentota bacterium]